MKPVRAATMAMLLGVLTSCASPSPTLYTVAVRPGPTQVRTPKVVVLQQVELARYLARLQIVRSSENYRLDVMANDWWGEPLAAMLTRVLLEELGQRLPDSVVLGENSPIVTKPGATVAVTIQRMDRDAAGNLVLLGQTGVRFGARGTPVLQNFRFTVRPSSPDIQGEVAAISTAVGQLADSLATTLGARSARHR